MVFFFLFFLNIIFFFDKTWKLKKHGNRIFFLGSLYHGHSSLCNKEDDLGRKLYNPNCPKVLAHNQTLKTKIAFYESLKNFYLNHNIKFSYTYEEEYDCEYSNHCISLSKKQFPSKINYEKFVSNIYNGSYEGFLILKDLAIKNDSRQSLHGFLVCKAPLLNKNHWSPFTNSFNLDPVKNSVCSVHFIPGIYVVHTSFFNFLKNTFDFEGNVNIIHAILYTHSNSLQNIMDRYLKKRRIIKDQLLLTSNSLLRLQLSIQANTIKVKLVK